MYVIVTVTHNSCCARDAFHRHGGVYVHIHVWYAYLHAQYGMGVNVFSAEQC